MGADQDVTLEGGGGAKILVKVLLYSSIGGTIVWSGDMGDYGDNDAAVRGRACEFPAAGQK